MAGESIIPPRKSPAVLGFVSIVADASGTTTKDANIVMMLNDIKTGKWRVQVEQIRANYARAITENSDPKKSVANLKKNLPGVMWSGQFSNRNKPVAEKLVAHSGLLCADLDDIGETILDVRAKLVASPHLFALFSSPRGNGLKAIFRVTADAKQHKTSFQSVEKLVLELTGVKIDGVCKDVSRLCFVSYDPDLFHNTTAKIIENPSHLNSVSCITASCGTASLRSGCLDAASLRSTSLHSTSPASSTSLHHKASEIRAKMRFRTEADEVLQASYPQNPGILKLYRQLIEIRFQAMPHTRNDTIVKSIPFLYCAVAPDVAVALLVCFYDRHRNIFNDPRKEHMAEVTAMLKSVAETYRQKLPGDVLGLYDELSEPNQSIFRICRDLASLKEPIRPDSTFFLAYNELADRLGIKHSVINNCIYRPANVSLD